MLSQKKVGGKKIFKRPLQTNVWGTEPGGLELTLENQPVRTDCSLLETRWQAVSDIIILKWDPFLSIIRVKWTRCSLCSAKGGQETCVDEISEGIYCERTGARLCSQPGRWLPPKALPRGAERRPRACSALGVYRSRIGAISKMTRSSRVIPRTGNNRNYMQSSDNDSIHMSRCSQYNWLNIAGFLDLTFCHWNSSLPALPSSQWHHCRHRYHHQKRYSCVWVHQYYFYINFINISKGKKSACLFKYRFCSQCVWFFGKLGPQIN